MSKARKLKDAAQKAIEKGKHKKALESYLALERLEPTDGQWPKRAADCYRRLDQRPAMIASLMRSVDRYAKAGFVVKAIAMCKQVLAVDADNDLALKALAEFSQARGVPMKSAPPPAPMPTLPAAPATPPSTPDVVASSPPPPPAHADGDRTIPEGAALDEVPLAEVVEGSREIPLPDAAMEEHSGIYEIPIDEIEFLDDDGTQDDIEVVVPLDHDDDDVSAEFDNAEQTIATVFPKTPLFSDLQPMQLEALVRRAELFELAAGETLFSQGDASEGLFVVADGAVAVISEGPPRVQLSRLEAGEFFGEIGLIAHEPRRATVQAVEDAEIIKISLDAIGDLIEQEPRVLQVLLRFLRERLIDHLVVTSPLFEPFAGDDRTTLAQRFKFLEVEAGATLVEQGGRAAGLFVLLAGRAEVVRDDDGQSRRLATLQTGDLFGEMSLLTQEPAVATVRSTQKCFVLEMPAAAFREVIMTHPQVLMFVGDLADQRRRENAAILEGSADYSEGTVELL